MRRLVVVAAAMGLLAVACAGGSSGVSGAAIRSAPDKTVAGKTSRLVLVVDRPKGQSGPTGVSLDINGEVDFAARQGHMTFDLSSLANGKSVNVVFLPAPAVVAPPSAPVPTPAPPGMSL